MTRASEYQVYKVEDELRKALNILAKVTSESDYFEVVGLRSDFDIKLMNTVIELQTLMAEYKENFHR